VAQLHQAVIGSSIGEAISQMNTNIAATKMPEVHNWPSWKAIKTGWPQNCSGWPFYCVFLHRSVLSSAVFWIHFQNACKNQRLSQWFLQLYLRKAVTYNWLILLIGKYSISKSIPLSFFWTSVPTPFLKPNSGLWAWNHKMNGFKHPHNIFILHFIKNIFLKWMIELKKRLF